MRLSQFTQIIWYLLTSNPLFTTFYHFAIFIFPFFTWFYFNFFPVALVNVFRFFINFKPIVPHFTFIYYLHCGSWNSAKNEYVPLVHSIYFHCCIISWKRYYNSLRCNLSICVTLYDCHRRAPSPWNCYTQIYFEGIFNRLSMPYNTFCIKRISNWLLHCSQFWFQWVQM